MTAPSPYAPALKLLTEYLKAGVPAVTRVKADGEIVITPVQDETPDDLSLTNWARK